MSTRRQIRRQRNDMIIGALGILLISLACALPSAPSRADPECQTTGTGDISISCTYTAKALAPGTGRHDLGVALNSARLSLKTDEINDMSVELTFTQISRVPIPDTLTVYLAIDDEVTNYVRRPLPGVDFRKLAPGKPQTFSERLRIAAFPPGHYTIVLWIPDPDPASTFDASHNFLLSSAGVANPATGLNVVARFDVKREGQAYVLPARGWAR